MEKHGFNLLRPQLSPEDRWDKIYNWVNSTARVIVIFVELIVIVCFVARVVIDRQARDLEEILEQNKNQLDSLKEVEQNVIKLQQKLSDYSNIWSSSSGYKKYIEEVYSYSPTIFRSYNVTVDDKGIIIIAGVSDEDDLNELESTIKSSDSFSMVQLSSFTPGGSEGDEPGEFQLEAHIAESKRDQLGPVTLSNSTVENGVDVNSENGEL